MAKFALLGGYTAEAWSKMIDNPGDRTAAVSKALEALGGKLESFYWSFGDDDFLGIIEVPDDTAAAAFSVAVGSSGTLRNVRTIKLISLDEGRKVLEKAKATKAAYSPPGARQAAGVR
ncbi:MAG TPA: GYD domain-containing protein [Candidatus Dormibacteraeota bacterium]|nr:GYD domain-containing protein [Candidatus Dormibacteraeota bacterium]